ncbi:MAG: Asp-tRNA(Asn)/Glu-tRNA(Gln) amidotransferase subunit GatB [Alphaproteobacteria bacterium]|nr:Asp-tRNA(Asn)/Glu-tRNA(Gln) amidotransferase subunit GatB [Alphaproteobacteria bacterium]
MTAATIQGKTGPWEMVIGLEVHAQVVAKAKLFSGAAADFGAEPNSQVSLVDAAMPGMLPVINAYCIEQAVKTGLGIAGAINRRSIFDRKNYFYADLPAGYQISQYSDPIVGRGAVTIDLPGGVSKVIGVTRLHLEQDAGKSLHDRHPTLTFVDLNRSGVALMEIVSEPDMRAPEEAALYLTKLRSILRYLGTCDGNMEEGSMRCDVNVSVRRPGEDLGTRCEVKNVNSIRYVRQAIEHEAGRQIAILEAGGGIDQETRLWDPVKGETRSMRSKEEAHDYRYFPDPDLLPLVLCEAEVARIEGSMPELPDAKKARFVAAYDLSAYDAGVLVADRETADFYEGVARGRDAKLAANWVAGDFFAFLNKSGKALAEAPVDAGRLGGLIDLIGDGTLSGRLAKEVFEAMWESRESALQVVERLGLKQISDTGAIEAAIDAVMARESGKVAEYRSGKEKLFGFFVGQVMRATAGKANPALVNDLLKRKLGG